MNKMREYERGREDGLDLARRITREGGLEAPRKGMQIQGSNRNTYFPGKKGPGQSI